MNPPELTRSSSFARSFFQAGQDGGAVLDGGTSTTAGRNGGMASARSSGSGSDEGNVMGTPTMMRRQRSRRRISVRSNGLGGGSGDKDSMQAAAAAATAAMLHGGGDDEEVGDGVGSIDQSPRKGGIPRPSRLSEEARQVSWYTDALLQSTSENLSALDIWGDGSSSGIGGISDVDGISNSNPGAGSTGNDDEDQVLEQYSIMAHVEATMRVKDNTGFDMAQYEKRRKMQQSETLLPGEHNYYTGENKPKPVLPLPRTTVLTNSIGGGGSSKRFYTNVNSHNNNNNHPSTTSSSSSSSSTRKQLPPRTLKPQEPSMSTLRQRFAVNPSSNNSSGKQQQQRFHARGQRRQIPELSPGVVISSSLSSSLHKQQQVISSGEHIVRCLGCKQQLKVSMMATMVQCPDCATVSPATSTRR